MSVVLGRIQSDGYSYSDTLWSPTDTWSYEEAVENDDNTISARSYFEDGTMTENGVVQPNYVMKATPNRIGDTRLDDTPIEKSLAALRIYAERVDHISFLDFLVSTGIAFEDPRVIIDTAGAINVTDAPYNAVGDGVADDTVAIQTALDENDKIYIPAGVYLVGRIRPRERTTLIYSDSGGELYGTDAYATITMGALSGSLTIDGITFNSQPALDGLSATINMSGGTNNVNTTIQNCTFKGTKDYAFNHISGNVYHNPEKIINFSLICNTFINTGRIAIEITDRNDDYDEPDWVPSSSLVGTKLLYNKFLNDKGVGQAYVTDGNHMFASIVGWGDDYEIDGNWVQDTTFIGNYIENCEWGLEVTGVDGVDYRYNELIQCKIPWASGNWHVRNLVLRYNYMDVPFTNDWTWVCSANGAIIEYNQISGNLRFEEHADLSLGYNKFYNVGGAKPVWLIDCKDSHLYSNYFESVDQSGTDSVLYISDTGTDIDYTLTIVENNNFYSVDHLPYYFYGLPVTDTNNTEVFTREALFPRVMPKMFK